MLMVNNKNYRNYKVSKFNRDSESVVFNSGKKMALRAFYFIRALTYYYISCHLFAAIKNN